MEKFRFKYKEYDFKDDYKMVQNWLDRTAIKNLGFDDYNEQIHNKSRSNIFDETKTVVAYLNNHPVASVFLTTKDNNATIYDIVVDNQLRGNGIGKNLIKDIALNINSFGFKNSITSIDAGIKLTNDASLYVFVDAGFKFKKQRDSYFVKINNLEKYRNEQKKNEKLEKILEDDNDKSAIY